MADIHRSRRIAALPQQVWDVLADFGSIASWADNVDHSCMLFSGLNEGQIGAARRVQVRRDAFVERITEFDPPHALAYDIEGLPRRVRRVSNRWMLGPDGVDAAAVTLTSTVEIGSGPARQVAEHILCRLLARQSDAMLAGLANRLENARV